MSPLRELTVAEELADAAARHLDEALGKARVLHERGQRETYRYLLALAIEAANRALAAATTDEHSAAASDSSARGGRRLPAHTRCRSILATAHAARARDALHGAGQLSLSAQRAPTSAACDEGWQRVAAIGAGAEESARVAALVARELEAEAPGSVVARRALARARDAEDAAQSLRRLVEERNHAYTFHTHHGFSFGEGWYLAAAAALTGVSIQIEPGQPGTAHAESFLRAAGLSHRLQPYRSRPRAMKQTTELVARAFRADAAAARRRLRAAFLGETPISEEVAAWLERRLGPGAGSANGRKHVLLWIRDGAHHPGRNTTFAELLALTARVERAGLVPVYTGDALREPVPAGVVDLILFWKDPVFQGPDMRRAQLGFFECLRERYGLVGQLGVTTAGMDGPALMGLPTLYLTEAPNVRMREWVGAVPGYREVVREPGYLERVGEVLDAWATSPARSEESRSPRDCRGS